MSKPTSRENKKTRAMAEDVKQLKKRQKKFFIRWIICMAVIVGVLAAIWIYAATTSDEAISMNFVIVYFIIMIVVLFVASFQWHKYSQAKEEAKNLEAKIQARQR